VRVLFLHIQQKMFVYIHDHIHTMGTLDLVTEVKNFIVRGHSLKHADCQASVEDSSTAHGVCSVFPHTSVVPLSVSMISCASDRSDNENVCVCCVGMSTVNKSSSKAAVTTPIVESSLELLHIAQ